MKDSKQDSFLEGSIFGALIRFAVPVLGALILQAAYGAVDLMVVGWFGDAASISAVGTGSSFMQMATFIITSLAMGSTVVIGQHIGEQKPEEAGNTVGTTILLFAGIGVVMTIALELFAGKIVGMLQVPAESVDKTILYLRICSAGILVIIAYNVISGVLRGVGNANLPFLFVGIACVVNIIGDLLLVGACKLDVAGAALATVLAQFVSVVLSAVIIRKQKLPISFSRGQCRIYARELKRILNVGIPIAIQETMVQISFLVVNAIVNEMGLMPSAGYGIAQKIISFIMLVPSSVMQSVSAFVAQNIGAGQKERAWRGFLTAMCTGCAVGVMIFLGGFFGGGAMSSIFTDDREVIAQSADYLRGFSIECILTCVLFSSIGYFNGRGRSIPVMIQGLSSAFCIRIPVSILMSRLPNASLMLVGLATPITTVYGIFFFVICFVRLRRERTKIGGG
ncbi:MAG: MATE family efflux transporter [Candidatus Gastranaerophilales bacterium]|nr:MATE family efflux transporter [Candidatus Gastranaerophilales bacterium]